MLLCFVDESDEKDLRCFAAVIADEHATKDLTAGLDRVMRQASVDYGIPATTEIHAQPLFHGKEEWKAVGQRARANLNEKLLDEILRAEVRILLRSVSTARLRARQARENYPVHFPPEQVCFQHILQRVDEIARRGNTHALVIADERGDRDRHRERFATYQVQGTPGSYMWTKLDTLLDTVHFAPSHHSRMLQAADLLAFTYRRHSTVEETDPRAQQIMERMWKKMLDSNKLYEPGSWP